MSVYLTHGKDGASLDELISAADAMNHAIPTRGELTRSLTRLASCRILSEEEERFRIADTHLPSIAQAKGTCGLVSMPVQGKKWLSRTHFDVDDSIRVSITDEQLSVACDMYRQRLWER